MKNESLLDMSDDIIELENFFNNNKIIQKTVLLNPGELINNINNFVKGHLNYIKYNKNNKTYLPYLNRLKKLKHIIENDKSFKSIS